MTNESENINRKDVGRIGSKNKKKLITMVIFITF